ncbi:MAG TPA: site-2 protease family protein [Acidobacteriota bacterium]
MKWAWRVGSIVGIPIYIHSTFVLIILWVAWAHASQGAGLAATLSGIVFILALFGCVVLHELGHALTARRYGIGTRDITLLPIGGLARLERMPDDPRQEFWVALAGPAVNVVIAAGLYGVLVLQGRSEPDFQLTITGGPFIERIMVVNVILVAFNMLPAFPMDGGRVLRAILAMRMEYSRATQVAATVGQGMALLFALFGLLYNPFLVFIALFVWIGATQESGMVQVRSALSGIPVARAMITEFHSIGPEEPLQNAVALTLSTAQRDFPVIEHGEVVGVLTQRELFRALAEDGQLAAVSEVMNRDFETADSFEMLEPVLQRLQTCDCAMMPVVRGGRLVGIITADNIGEFLSIQSAVDGRAGSAASR